MTKEVLLIYQDCPYCEPRTEWGKRQMKLAKDYEIKVVETPYNAVGAKGLILEAQSHGANALPFFTDGVKFAYDLSEFVEVREADKPTAEDKAAAPKAVSKKTRAKKQTVEVEEKTEDEAIPEAE